jgi:homoserine kinase type II
MTNQQLADYIVDNYDIGTLVRHTHMPVGTVNTSYMVETSRGGVVGRYLLRIYKQGTQASEIEFEHSLLDHLIVQGFDLVAPPLPTRKGTSWVQCGEETEAGSLMIFYAVFKFLEGSDKYPWDNPACSPLELQSSAQVLARYHEKVSGFVPQGQRQEPRILDILPQIAAKTESYIDLDQQSSFDRLLRRHGRLITDNIDDTIKALEPVAIGTMPELAIHCDYHPGNLKYQQGLAIGLFDFDWSKIDYRLFDVALALYYFCTLWRGARDGELHTGKLAAFLNTYQDAAAENIHTGPLTFDELACLVPMIAAANIYVLNWTLVDFYSKTCDPDVYGAYLEHHIRQMQWTRTTRNRQLLDRITQI